VTGWRYRLRCCFARSIVQLVLFPLSVLFLSLLLLLLLLLLLQLRFAFFLVVRRLQHPLIQITQSLCIVKRALMKAKLPDLLTCKREPADWPPRL
jgi:hypothetical protein